MKNLVINSWSAVWNFCDDRSVYVQKADDSYQSRTAVKFLSGIGKLSDDFHLRFEKENPPDEEGILIKTRRQAQKMIQPIDRRAFLGLVYLIPYSAT